MSITVSGLPRPGDPPGGVRRRGGWRGRCRGGLRVVAFAGTAAGDGGGGVTSSLLGTVKDAAGSPKVTYDGWPVYTFIGDSGPGVAHGKGLTSSGGTWYVLNASGAPVTSSQSQPASSPSAGGGGGYGY